MISASHEGGMSLLHDHGIVHSDLSANNVLLKAAANNRRFTAAVSDFGLSRMCADMPAGQCTQTVGTVSALRPWSAQPTACAGS